MGAPVLKIELTLHRLQAGPVPVRVEVTEVLLAGYTGRDRAKVLEHIHELELLGVKPPDRVPAVYVVEPSLLRPGTDGSVPVSGPETSGEVEIYLANTLHGWVVGVGSDHTDRREETVDIPRSKGMCPKAISPNVWLYADLEDHWDQLQLRSWVWHDGARRLYQDGTLASFLRIPDLWEELRQAGHPDLAGRVVFGGTLPLQEGFVYGQRFETELFDPVLRRRLQCGYDVVVPQVP